jgi:hypothetical protein
LFFKKTKPVQTDQFRFGSVFLGQKPVQTGLAQFFQFGSVLAEFFFWFGSVFFLFFFGLGSVRFGLFGFRLIKPKPNQTEPVDFF